MIDIYELDEEQLKEYAGSQSDEAKECSRLEDVISTMKKLKERHIKIEDKYESAISALKERNFNKIEDICTDMAISLDRLSGQIKLFPSEIGEKSSNTKIRLDKIDKRKKLLFYRNNICLRVIMPELLPHKQQYDVQTGKMKYYYDIDSWRATYYSQFAKEFINGKYKMFSEKASICYIMHIPQNMINSVYDTDNYDTKVLTDIIATFLLHDDNFICCNYFVDITVDKKLKDADECYTDIVICDAKNRESLLKNLY